MNSVSGLFVMLRASKRARFFWRSGAIVSSDMIRQGRQSGSIR
jgi:hypothetical protein